MQTTSFVAVVIAALGLLATLVTAVILHRGLPTVAQEVFYGNIHEGSKAVTLAALVLLLCVRVAMRVTAPKTTKQARVEKRDRSKPHPLDRRED